MKGSGKVIVFVGFLAFLLISYVHVQISLFRVSYQIDKNAKVRSKKVEEYRYLKYEVDQMKAPRILEERMNELKLDLTLPNEIHVVQVAQQPPVKVIAQATHKIVDKSFQEKFFDFFGRWVRVAQAKTEE